MNAKPRCWVDEHNVICFGRDVRPEEWEPLSAIVHQAFRAGLRSGYRQGLYHDVNSEHRTLLALEGVVRSYLAYLDEDGMGDDDEIRAALALLDAKRGA